MSSTLLLNPALTQTFERQLSAGRVCVEALPCEPGELNQDSVALLDLNDHGTVLVVADGMGGGPAGAEASAQAVRAVARQVETAINAERSLRAGIMDGFEAAQAAVLKLAAGAATTLLVAEITDSAVRTYHAGDSAACVFGRGGKLKLQTDFHSPVGYALKSGMLDEEAAIVHEQRHVVSNIIGMSDMSIQVGSPLQLARFDTLVLGSDGLFDNLLIAEVGELVRRGALTLAAQNLKHEVLARMHAEPGSLAAETPCKPDDLALLLFRLY